LIVNFNDNDFLEFFARKSQSMEECLICLELIQEDYAVVNNVYERGIYHTSCLEKWLKDSTRGVLSREKPTSYMVFRNGVGREIFINMPTPLVTERNIENQSRSGDFILYLLLFIMVGIIFYYFGK